MEKNKLKKAIQSLRKKGHSYSEIRNIIGQNISKSTISYWCKKVILSSKQARLLKEKTNRKLGMARTAALKTNKEKRESYLNNLRDTNQPLINLSKDVNIAKLMLAMLYLGEGSKNRNGALVFGNSDPGIIKLFLRLLRLCYPIDENRFRCTLQCRADQDIKLLERFWSNITQIPLSKFYDARIDPRTIGRPSKKKDYKGVCRIDHFSANIYNELTIIAQLLNF